MRQSIGGTWLLQLMLLFILLFSGFIILTLNYSKTIKLKNEMISIIEKYEGLNDKSIELLNTYLGVNSYGVKGGCGSGDGIYGASDLTTSTLEEAQQGKKYYYCVKKYSGSNTSNYYQISIFYKFNLPVIGDTSSFTIKGTTSNFQASDSTLYSKVIGD